MDKNNKVFKYITSKKGFAFVSQVATIILVLGLSILTDYIKVGGTMDFINEWWYWLVVSTNLILIVILMITVRNMRKNKQIAQNDNIINGLNVINNARRVVLNYGYSDRLQDYIEEVNKENKYQAYINKWTKKLNRVLIMPMPAKRKDKKIREIEEKLKLPKEQVLELSVRYKKITQTGLFANVDGKIAVSNRFDISSHETRDIAEMVGYKALIVYLFAGITGTFAISFFFNGLNALWGTLLKILSMFVGVNSAINQADNFVIYNIEQSLNNRLDIVLKFVSQNEDVKEKIANLQND